MSLVLNSGFTLGPGVVLDANPYIPPTVTTNGLRLYLDAGNPSSYPGSGNTWTDLIAANAFTLYNGPTYSADNGGYLTFDPNSIQWADGSSLATGLTNWTAEVWHYYGGTMINGSPCILTELYFGNPINFTLGNTQDASPNLQAGYFNGGWISTPLGYTLTEGNWYHIAGSWDGTTIKLYINGAVASSYTPDTPPTADRGGNGIRLMGRWDNAQYWGGRLAVVRIYDTALGNAGVLQNYDAERARFGL
jgi:hypothetical protein